jgi:hypothetical protein
MFVVYFSVLVIVIVIVICRVSFPSVVVVIVGQVCITTVGKGNPDFWEFWAHTGIRCH